MVATNGNSQKALGIKKSLSLWLGILITVFIAAFTGVTTIEYTKNDLKDMHLGLLIIETLSTVACIVLYCYIILAVTTDYNLIFVFFLYMLFIISLVAIVTTSFFYYDDKYQINNNTVTPTISPPNGKLKDVLLYSKAIGTPIILVCVSIVFFMIRFTNSNYFSNEK